MWKGDPNVIFFLLYEKLKESLINSVTPHLQGHVLRPQRLVSDLRVLLLLNHGHRVEAFRRLLWTSITGSWCQLRHTFNYIHALLPRYSSIPFWRTTTSVSKTKISLRVAIPSGIQSMGHVSLSPSSANQLHARRKSIVCIEIVKNSSMICICL